jgi:hypothetical protein
VIKFKALILDMMGGPSFLAPMSADASPPINLGFAHMICYVPIMDWPADKVERRPIAALLPYAQNPRTHSEAQIKASH